MTEPSSGPGSRDALVLISIVLALVTAGSFYLFGEQRAPASARAVFIEAPPKIGEASASSEQTNPGQTLAKDKVGGRG